MTFCEMIFSLRLSLSKILNFIQAILQRWILNLIIQNTEFGLRQIVSIFLTSFNVLMKWNRFNLFLFLFHLSFHNFKSFCLFWHDWIIQIKFILVLNFLDWLTLIKNLSMSLLVWWKIFFDIILWFWVNRI